MDHLEKIWNSRFFYCFIIYLLQKQYMLITEESESTSKQTTMKNTKNPTQWANHNFNIWKILKIFSTQI